MPFGSANAQFQRPLWAAQQGVPRRGGRRAKHRQLSKFGNLSIRATSRPKAPGRCTSCWRGRQKVVVPMRFANSSAATNSGGGLRMYRDKGFADRHLGARNSGLEIAKSPQTAAKLRPAALPTDCPPPPRQVAITALPAQKSLHISADFADYPIANRQRLVTIGTFRKVRLGSAENSIVSISKVSEPKSPASGPARLVNSVT